MNESKKRKTRQQLIVKERKMTRTTDECMREGSCLHSQLHEPQRALDWFLHEQLMVMGWKKQWRTKNTSALLDTHMVVQCRRKIDSCWIFCKEIYINQATSLKGEESIVEFNQGICVSEFTMEWFERKKALSMYIGRRTRMNKLQKSFYLRHWSGVSRTWKMVDSKFCVVGYIN